MSNSIRMILVAVLVHLSFCHFNSGDMFPIQDYELRRPLQYFFRLMELKAKFNPMFGAMYQLGEDCSSKAGPFCQLTEH